MKRKDFLKKAGILGMATGMPVNLTHHLKSKENRKFKDFPIGLFDLQYTLEFNLNDPVEVRQAWDHAHTAATLQGIVNREVPRLYFFFVNNDGVNIDRYWWQKYREKGRWLYERETHQYENIVNLIEAYRNDIQGAVVYDPGVAATSNIASAVAGADDLVAIRYDPSPDSLFTRLITKGPQLPVKVWLLHPNGESIFKGGGKIPGTNRESTGSSKNDAYLWLLEHYVKKGKCNANYGAFYIDQEWMKNPKAAPRNHHTLTNHDFFVSRNAFFFDLSPWEDEPATDDPEQEKGTDLFTLKELLLHAYQQHRGKETCYIGGFPPWAFKYTDHVGGKHGGVPTEWQYTKIISAYNGFQDADAIGYGALANASFWQHFPLKKRYPQPWIRKNKLRDKNYLDEDGQINFKGRKFIIFYVGDYDAASWVSQTTPSLWDHPDRGKVPLMWCISPVLEERVPMALAYRRETATKNDYFAAADNGAGYLNPGMLQEPRPISGLKSGVEAWRNHCLPYYKRWDLSITGFIIDGYAPGLDEGGLDGYAAFSPNGIVPQKIPSTFLHGNMPVLRAGPDVNDEDPGKAAHKIMKHVQQNTLPFNWFRNILKSPGWYADLVKEIRRLDASIELLDAPTFFELLRVYLKNHPELSDKDSNQK